MATCHMISLPCHSVNLENSPDLMGGGRCKWREGEGKRGERERSCKYQLEGGTLAMELGLGALGDIEAAELLHSPEQLAHLARVLQEHQEQHRGVVSLARGRGRRHVLGCVGPALQPLRTSWHVSGKKMAGLLLGRAPCSGTPSPALDRVPRLSWPRVFAFSAQGDGVERSCVNKRSDTVDGGSKRRDWG